MKVRMKAPEGATSCSTGGETHDVVDGHVVVTHVEAAELKAHGFELVGPVASSAPVEMPQPDTEADPTPPPAPAPAPAKNGKK